MTSRPSPCEEDFHLQTVEHAWHTQKRGTAHGRASFAAQRGLGFTRCQQHPKETRTRPFAVLTTVVWVMASVLATRRWVVVRWTLLQCCDELTQEEVVQRGVGGMAPRPFLLFKQLRYYATSKLYIL